MRAVSYITGINHSVVLEMAGPSHNSACCESKLRSSLEAASKQFRGWLDYVCCVAKMLHYPSLGVHLVFLRSPYDDSEMARNEFEEGSKMVRR